VKAEGQRPKIKKKACLTRRQVQGDEKTLNSAACKSIGWAEREKRGWKSKSGGGSQFIGYSKDESLEKGSEKEKETPDAAWDAQRASKKRGGKKKVVKRSLPKRGPGR